MDFHCFCNIVDPIRRHLDQGSVVDGGLRTCYRVIVRRVGFRPETLYLHDITRIRPVPRRAGYNNHSFAAAETCEETGKIYWANQVDEIKE